MSEVILRACDGCHYKKVKCDRKDPCASCTEAATSCVRTRKRPPRQRKRELEHQDDGPKKLGLEELLKGLSKLDPQERRALTAFLYDDNAIPSSSNATVSQVSSEYSQMQRVHTQFKELSQSAGSPDAMQVEPSRKRSAPSLAQDIRESPSQTDDSGIDVESEEGYYHIQPSIQARSFIQQELEVNSVLDTEKRKVLECAIMFANQFINIQPGADVADIGPHMKSDPQYKLVFPSADFLSTLLEASSTSTRTITSYGLAVSSHVSRRSLERMGIALIERTVSGQTRLQYIVCVNLLAYLYLVATDSNVQSETMRRHLDRLREEYLSSGIEALERMSLLKTPCLSLLQALISGGILMQQTGNLEKCWQLSAAASNVIVALGGRYIATLSSGPAVDEAMEACQTLCQCYILDKSLSMSLGRPSSLPEMDLRTSSLLPNLYATPGTVMTAVYLEFARFQDAIIAESRRRPQADFQEKRLERLRQIQQDMAQIRKKIKEWRSRPPHSDLELLRAEWMGVDFVYFSILTALLRLHPFLKTDQSARSDCLNSARQALCSIRKMHNHNQKHSGEAKFKVFSFSTIILLYPLCPFFVIFCNVVATSNIRDFELLREVTASLKLYSQHNRSIWKIQQLFIALVTLCQSQCNIPSIEVQEVQPLGYSIGELSLPAADNHFADPAELVTGRSNVDAISSLQNLTSGLSQDLLDTQGVGWFGNDALGNLGFDLAGAGDSGWSHDLFWDLFDTQSVGD